MGPSPAPQRLATASSSPPRGGEHCRRSCSQDHPRCSEAHCLAKDSGSTVTENNWEGSNWFKAFGPWSANTNRHEPINLVSRRILLLPCLICTGWVINYIYGSQPRSAVICFTFPGMEYESLDGWRQAFPSETLLDHCPKSENQNANMKYQRGLDGISTSELFFFCLDDLFLLALPEKTWKRTNIIYII